MRRQPLRLLLIVMLALAVTAPGAQELPSDLRFDPVVSGLNQPLGIRHAGDQRLFVIQQGGQIRILENGIVLPEPFLNFDTEQGGTDPPLGFIAGGERGLLGLAFDPLYAANRRFYVYYTDGEGDTVVARFLRDVADPDRADPTSGEIVLRIDQGAPNHNAGDIHFGIDGYLYIASGDGGPGNDPCDRAQTLDPADLVNGAGDNGTDCAPDAAFTDSGGNPNSRALLGKMLRIDVAEQPGGPEFGGGRCGDGGTDTGYAIPPDNPYANPSDGVCDEVYASGLRNPYRFSVDRLNGDLWIGDVGQNVREEINHLPAGQGGLNYGWRCREGFIANPKLTCENTPPFTEPVVEIAHPRDRPIAITGGFRYRGPNPDLAGLVFYGDFVNGDQYALRWVNSAWQATLWNQIGNPAGYGEDVDGNLYMADYSGTIYRLVAPVIFASGLEPGE